MGETNEVSSHRLCIQSHSLTNGGEEFFLNATIPEHPRSVHCPRSRWPSLSRTLSYKTRGTLALRTVPLMHPVANTISSRTFVGEDNGEFQ